MTPNWAWRLGSQKYSIYTEYLPLRSKFWSVLLYDKPFPRYNMYKVGESQKCTEWTQTELEDFTIKCTLYTLNTRPWGPNFGPFRSTGSRFRYTTCTTCTRWAKIGTAPNDSKLNLSTWQSKVLYIHLVLTHEAQILVRFALRLAVSEIHV